MNKNLHIIYTAEQIQQYLEGKLSPLQMHAMEKAALDDPFLAEAIEGYESVKEKQWKEQLALLKKQLEEQKSNTRVVTMHRATNKWWKAAAAVLLLLVGTTVTYLFTRDNTGPDKNLATVETAKGTEQSAATTSTIATDTNLAGGLIKSNAAKATDPDLPVSSDSRTVVVSTDPNKKNTTLAQSSPGNPGTAENFNLNESKEEIAKRDDSKIAPTSAPVISSDPPTPQSQRSGVVNAAAKNEADLLAVRKQKDVLANQKGNLPLNHSFFAQVVGPDNTPLPFSNINIKSEDFGTYADVKGNFRLLSSDSTVLVEVRSIGYLPRQFMLNSKSAVNKISLAEDVMAIKERTVIGNSRSSSNANTIRRVRLVKDSIFNIEPADGWENYNTYVANNIQIPDDLIDKNKHGEMEISFNVSSNGAISNIKVDKSTCNNCETLAKKLLESGPQWKLKKGKSGKARVRLEY